MQNFKRIILPMQGHSKNDLHWLYNTRCVDDPPLIFRYFDFQFWFEGTSYRSCEKLLLYVQIPGNLLMDGSVEDSLPHETYLLRTVSPVLAELGRSYLNKDKNIREKAQFEVQTAGEYMIRRNGIRYDREKEAFILRINFNVPLVNALSVNAKAAVRAVRDILEHIENALKERDREELNRYVKTYEYQLQIRKYMKEHELCTFIANGSILPRENGTSAPMQKAVAFVSPAELEVRIPLADGTEMAGMGIPRGITVITGGGYSGKSTFLDAVEMGIYNHIPGDGREYVLTDDSALKIYAEDGRPVSELDLSPFFRYLPGGMALAEFSTPHASGSVSQAANIIEAVCGKCKLMLIDEDKSATNFMIRDKNMRFIVRDEPIIPFTDRVRELYLKKGVSTILVIGGSSEYLAYADNVILMKDYLPEVITDEIKKLALPEPNLDLQEAGWTESRRLIPRETTKAFLVFSSVKTENEKKIILDEYSADITLLTALVSGHQLNTLARVMERLLTDEEADREELLLKAEQYAVKALQNDDAGSLIPEAAQCFCEEIRPIDAFCCVNRMRGAEFKIH